MEIETVKIIQCQNRSEQEISKDIKSSQKEGYSIVDKRIDDNGEVIMIAMQKIKK